MQKGTQVNTTKKLKLLDQRITIKYIEQDMHNGCWIYGHTEWKSNNVIVYISLKNSDNKPFTEDELNSTVRHELFHVILGALYFETERDNETLVEWLAQATKMLNKQGINI